jgi:CyaY protein
LENEIEYRAKIQKVYQLLEKVFETIDPDLAECEHSLGSLSITFGDQSRCILSAQPSVRQLWLAIAARGTAYHFNYDSEKNAWIDDKNRGIELLAFLSRFFEEMIGRSFDLNQYKGKCV